MPKISLFGKNFFLYSFLIILTDQFSKKLVQENWPNFLLCNQEMALSLPKISVLFWFFYLLLFSFLLWELSKKPDYFPLFLILGGALSNLFDRLSLGCVLDWITLHTFPVFNLADVAICLGAVWLIYEQFKKN